MLLELPAGLSLRYIHPRYVFSAALVTFGVLAACLAVVDGYAGVMVIRVLIGYVYRWVQLFFKTRAWLHPSRILCFL